MKRYSRPLRKHYVQRRKYQRTHDGDLRRDSTSSSSSDDTTLSGEDTSIQEEIADIPIYQHFAEGISAQRTSSPIIFYNELHDCSEEYSASSDSSVSILDRMFRGSDTSVTQFSREFMSPLRCCLPVYLWG